MTRCNNRFRWDAGGQYVLRDSIRPQNTTVLHANKWHPGESSMWRFRRPQFQWPVVSPPSSFAVQHFAARLNATKCLRRDIDLTSNNIFHLKDELHYWKVENLETLRVDHWITCRSFHLFQRAARTSHSANAPAG